MTSPSCAGDGVGQPPPNKATQAFASPTARHPSHGSTASPKGAPSPDAAACVGHSTWGLVETMDIMADDDLVNDLAKSDEDIRAGRVVLLDDLLSDLKIDAEKEGARAAGLDDERQRAQRVQGASE